ncbi:LINE-1 retrotransposable element ORF1 protein [Holothuria leucospilota]|uniref:LINE-1 retrotransposable element ORF1 protein n=1 Tax=Holothuria leucospilota TaxID=206669 RepID=A0A9Q1BTA5_HOLLE|nr:LINE-1 retrotransposable element ORF1 protein [Holothuria leucospilota]
MATPQSSLEQAIDEAIEKILQKVASDLKIMKTDFMHALNEHEKRLEALEAENLRLEEQYDTLVKELEEHKKLGELHSQDLNKLERFSRRNNIRLIGIPETDQENCDTTVSEVLRKIGLEDCKLERAHRDGRRIPGKPRHIIAKLTFYKDKVYVMKNARRSLANETYFVVDDLTLKDLKEKRRWKNEVSQLFANGTFSHFSGGRWRTRDGRPFAFHSS